MDEHKQVIETYVRESLAAGYAPEAIRAQLLQSGWSEASIAEAMRAQAMPPEQLLEPGPATPEVTNQVTRPAASESKNSSKAPFMIVGIAIVLILLIAGGLLFLHNRSSNKPLATTGLSVAQRDAQDNQRKDDVQRLLGGIAQFISDNNGVLPTQTVTGSGARELTFCGPDCDVNKTTVTLDYFQNAPEAVSFHAYKQGLTVPNDQTAYIVPQASCINGTLTPNQARSIAILSESATLGQQCTAL